MNIQEIPKVLVFIEDDKVATSTIKETVLKEWIIVRIKELESDMNESHCYPAEWMSRVDELKTFFCITEADLEEK